MTPQHVTIDMKATKQRFYVVLFIMMHIAFFYFKSVHENSMGRHS